MNKPNLLITTVLAVIVGSVVVGARSFAGAEANPWVEKSDKRAAVQMPSLAPLVRDVEPAVLSIYVESKVANAGNDPRLDMLRRFGFQMEVPDFKQQGQGTGFLIHPDGYALTNHHVVEGATKIQVRVDSSRTLVDAVVVGDDPRTDVALLKLQGTPQGGGKWPAIPLGDSDALEVGDMVVAIGNPFGLSQSVSMGILSAKGRRDIAPSGRRGLYDFLQTDASINPGNSGGPLLNLSGEVIGINSAINAAGQGIGFAIPINLVKKLIPELKKSGHISRAWIGLQIQSVNADVAKGLGLSEPRGALVAQVVPKSPGYKAGLKPGDVVLKFDGKAIEDSSDLPLLAATAGVGRAVTLELMRDGEMRSAKITLEAMPDDEARPARTGDVSPQQAPGKIGLRIDTLDDELRSRLDLPARQKGAVVVGVAAGSVAEDAGLAQGDVIIEVNGKDITDANGFIAAIDKVASGKLVKLLVLRGGSTTFVAFVKP